MQAGPITPDKATILVVDDTPDDLLLVSDHLKTDYIVKGIARAIRCFALQDVLGEPEQEAGFIVRHRPGLQISIDTRLDETARADAIAELRQAIEILQRAGEP